MQMHSINNISLNHNHDQSMDSLTEFQHNEMHTTYSQCQTAFFQHNLPPLSQPLLKKYKSAKLKLDFTPKKSQDGFFCKVFIQKKSQPTSLCKCAKNQHGICSFMMNIIQDYYDWEKDKNFKKAYEHYNRRKMQIFLSDDDIQKRLSYKIQLLGGSLHQNCKIILIRIIKNYIKHTIVYKKDRQLTRENDLYFWFLIGIYYHIGLPSIILEPQNQKIESDQIKVQLCEASIFWALDMVMNKFGNLTRQTQNQKCQQTIFYMKKYFQQELNFMNSIQIPIFQLVQQWLSQFMMSYIGIQLIGFFIASLLKFGWKYAIKIMLSHLQKRLDKLKAQQLFKQSTDKQTILKMLIDSHQEWPMLFANTQTFPF